jgi:hypothetical protein
MDYIKYIIFSTIDFIKSIIEIAKPVVNQLSILVLPIIMGIFTFLININYYGIVTSKPFIGFIIFLFILFLIYAYLSMYNQRLLKNIIDFLSLTKPKSKRKQKFKFNSNFDISVETK